MTDFIKNYIKDSIQTKQSILNDEKMIQDIKNIANVIVKAYKNDKKVLIAGNGGSAADAQHIAAELVSKFYLDRAGLNAIALTVDTSVLTAIGNDNGFEKIFSRQVQANGTKGDIFIGLSTSGNSKNMLEAMKEAKEKGLVTIGLVGKKECEMDNLCDFIIKVPSSETPKIQESHIMIGHILCAIVENDIFGN